MKVGWQISTLADTCEMYQPQTITGKEMVENGPYPVFGANGIIGRYDKYNHEEPQLLITCRGATCGSVNVSEPKSWVTGNAMVVRPKNNAVDLRFLEYLFRGGINISKAITGAAQPQITRTNLAPLEISYPISLEEQKRIVGILDEAFENIATAKVNAEKNLQNARALFESYLQTVFSQRGEGWVEKTIGETCTLRSGTTVSPTLEKPVGDIPYLKVADMTFDGNEDQITTSSRFLRVADVRESTIIPKGATIFPKRGGAILTNKKRITSLPICADLNIMAVIPSSQIDARLLYFYFLNVDMRKLGTGSSIPQINNYDVAPLLISFPKSLTTQEEIVSKLDALREQTQHLEAIYQQKLDALEALKMSLLDKAFTGNL